MTTQDIFYSLDFHVFQISALQYASCKMFSEIILSYSIIIGKQIMITLFLACFFAQAPVQRNSEKNPSEKVQKLPKKVLEEKSPVSKVTGYISATY